ncbi:MAG: hypothetical protein ACC645_08540 [Pirellulales bacterium]
MKRSRCGDGFLNAPKVPEIAQEVQVATTPHDVVYEEGTLKLLRYRNELSIDFSGDEGLLQLWTDEKYFDVDGLVDAFGNCPGSFLQSSFQMMKPVQNFMEKYNTFYENMHSDRFLENFFAMERWGNDNIPVAGETFREFVKMLYQKNMLVRDEMRLADTPVHLDQITCPLLMLVAELDHLVPPGSTLALREYVGSKEIKEMVINAGHIGLAVSSKAHRQLWPDAAMWIADHSTPRHS